MGLNEFVLFVDFVGFSLSGVRSSLQLIFSVNKLLLRCLSLLVMLCTTFFFFGAMLLYSVVSKIVFVLTDPLGKEGKAQQGAPPSK